MITLAWLWLERRIGAGGAALLVLVLLILASWAINAAWSGVVTWYWRSEATALEAYAKTAKANAASADRGAQNATRTRADMGAAVAASHDRTEAAARRVEAHEYLPVDPAERSPLDPASVLELDAAYDRARAAADRLRGAR